MYNETLTGLQFIADDYVPNPRKEEYAKWLLEKFNLETVTLEDIETLSQNVQNKYAILFADWMKKYYN
jgi:ABC-type multidrug transport system ATPase subunit